MWTYTGVYEPGNLVFHLVGARVYSSHHQARGGVQLEQINTPSQGQDLEKLSFLHTFIPIGNLK